MKHVSFESLLEPGAATLVVFKYEDADGGAARIWRCKTEFLFQSLK
jgi:hypothetical protein